VIVGGGFVAGARAAPDRPALRFDGRSVPAGALLTLALRVAGGIGPGSTVAIRGANAPEVLAAILGTALAGGTAGVLDPGWPPAQRDAALAVLMPDLIFDEGGLGPPVPALPEVDPGAPFYAGFTAGSSGHPKQFRRSHRSWVETFEAGRAAFGLEPDDHVLIPGPIAHSLYLWATLDAVDRGALVDLLPRFDAAAAADRIEGGADRLVLVPTMIMLLAALGRTFPGVRTVLVGGARLDGAVEAQAVRLFPAAEIAEFYGASELSFVAWRSNRSPAPAASVGRLFPGVSLAIRDTEGCDLPAGMVGTVWVRSPMLALPGPDFVIRGGWATVGDQGVVDGAGHLSLVGRAGEMIVTGGLNAYPAAIEATLCGDPAVASAIVFGRPDAYWGETVVAVVEPRPGEVPTRHGLTERCLAALPRHACPRAILTIPALPRTPLGKIARAAVRAGVLAGDPAYAGLP
jgi:long-chain acyl-CoA synthetase